MKDWFLPDSKLDIENLCALLYGLYQYVTNVDLSASKLSFISALMYIVGDDDTHGTEIQHFFLHSLGLEVLTKSVPAELTTMGCRPS